MILSILDEIAAERLRQIEEGFDRAHDDAHQFGELPLAAACYATNAATQDTPVPGWAPEEWPWNRLWWKPKDRRTDLIKAAALIVAEIERLDRGGQTYEWHEKWADKEGGA